MSRGRRSGPPKSSTGPCDVQGVWILRVAPTSQHGQWFLPTAWPCQASQNDYERTLQHQFARQDLTPPPRTKPVEPLTWRQCPSQQQQAEGRKLTTAAARIQLTGLNVTSAWKREPICQLPESMCFSRRRGIS